MSVGVFARVITAREPDRIRVDFLASAVSLDLVRHRRIAEEKAANRTFGR
ncbi:hypothetical protein [Nonomuraea sp. LPB2021202275-12-8]